MKILFSSYLFDPSIGGIETVSKILAEKFSESGNTIHVITQSQGGTVPGANYELTRRPSIREIFRLLRWCDIFFQNNITLRSLIPALLLRKPTVVVHQTWLRNVRGGTGWQNRLKQWLLRYVTNVAISKAVAERLSSDAIVIGNPYDETVFQLTSGSVRDKKIAFVGRLVSDKGVDLLLHALAQLKQENLLPDLTIIGAGPEESQLHKLTAALGLDGQVTFAGIKAGRDLAEILNRHTVLAVPSLWAEPFGVVALEGIACGCVIVGSENGGLPEAIGPCGLTFQNGNAAALAAQLKRLIVDNQLRENLKRGAAKHLARFSAEAISDAYLAVMKNLLPQNQSI